MLVEYNTKFMYILTKTGSPRVLASGFSPIQAEKSISVDNLVGAGNGAVVILAVRLWRPDAPVSVIFRSVTPGVVLLACRMLLPKLCSYTHEVGQKQRILRILYKGKQGM